MRRLSCFIVIYLLAWAHVTLAGEARAQYSEIHHSLGRFRFVERFDYDAGMYVITVFSAKGKRLQDIKLDAISSPPYVVPIASIYDVDGDGYKDLVAIEGYGAGPYPSTLLFRFSKASGRFEKDASFPGYNVPTPSKIRGCVYLDEHISAAGGYTVTEWCLSPGIQTWKAGKACNSSSDSACYDAIAKYQFTWHRKHK